MVHHIWQRVVELVRYAETVCLANMLVLLLALRTSTRDFWRRSGDFRR